MRRFLTVSASALLLLALAPATYATEAMAAPASRADSAAVAKARREAAKARVLVERAVDLVASGDRPRAYELARTAYLDHFELAEVPLRLRDANLVLDAEYGFAELRNGIEGGKPQEQIEATARDIRLKLDEVDRTLTEPGVAVPLMTTAFSFSIIFREGLEAVLMLAILLGTLEAGRAAGYRRPLAWGVGVAVAATFVTWLLAELVIDIAPVNRELLAGITGLLAVAVLFFVTFWLVSRLDQRRWMEFMRARVSTAIATGSALAFAGLGFTAVYREGFETVLFYQTLLLFAKGLVLWVVVGLLAGVAALGGVGWAILRLGRRLPIRAFLGVSATVILLLSIAFIGNAVSALQEGDVVQVTPVGSGLVRLPVFLADLTGIHATLEGLAAQAALALVYLTGIVYIAIRVSSRRRRAVEVRV